jgi:hypothetical protein
MVDIHDGLARHCRDPFTFDCLFARVNELCGAMEEISNVSMHPGDCLNVMVEVNRYAQAKKKAKEEQTQGEMMTRWAWTDIRFHDLTEKCPPRRGHGGAGMHKSLNMLRSNGACDPAVV